MFVLGKKQLLSSVLDAGKKYETIPLLPSVRVSVRESKPEDGKGPNESD